MWLTWVSFLSLLTHPLFPVLCSLFPVLLHPCPDFEGCTKNENDILLFVLPAVTGFATREGVFFSFQDRGMFFICLLYGIRGQIHTW
ncbi:hypothetical protein F5H01DRAFT_333413 [Linnemannia elongata]|nr:hypothetical protein F5H01DRAFT_333413 [Linnemannia elongata]